MSRVYAPQFHLEIQPLQNLGYRFASPSLSVGSTVWYTSSLNLFSGGYSSRTWILGSGMEVESLTEIDDAAYRCEYGTLTKSKY